MNITIEVDRKSLEEVTRKVKSLFTAVISKDVEDILLGGAKIGKKEVKSRAPVGPTGNLKKAVVAKKSKLRGGVFRSAFFAMNRKKAPHSHLVEYGTAAERLPKKAKVLYDKRTGTVFGRKVAAMPAKPFFRPAAEAAKNAIEKHVNDGLVKLIERTAKK